MKTLAVVSRKGGAGKTTVAVNLTLAARAAGLKAVLADADPLRSATQVLQSRTDPAPVCFATSPAKLFALVQACRRSGADLLVIDSPAAPEADMMEVVRVADLCLTVTRPSYLDLAAAVRSATLIEQLGSKTMAVLNQCATPRNGVEPPAVLKAFEALRVAGLSAAPTAIRARIAYQNAFSQLRSVVELDGAEAAKIELQALLAEVWTVLHADARPPIANDDGPRAFSSPLSA